MEQDLPATSDQFSLSISLFALVQGLMPIAWSAISEIKGRKVRFSLHHAYDIGISRRHGIACLPHFSGLCYSCLCRDCSEPFHWAVSDYSFSDEPL